MVFGGIKMCIEEIIDYENYYYEDVYFEELLNKTLKEIIVNDDCCSSWEEYILFRTIENEEYIMYHEQECSEMVWIEDICGDIKKLIGKPLKIVQENSNLERGEENYEFSQTYTFYKLANENEYVTIRWFGCSNGFYSERVEFVKKIRKNYKFKE